MYSEAEKKAQEKLYSRNFTKFGLDMNIFVSVVAALLVLTFVIFTIARPTISAESFASANAFLNENLNWFYVLTINGALIFLLVLGISKFGKIRLGGFNAKPEYTGLAWYSMMFSAGIGIGIFFYGVASPIYHRAIPQGLVTGSPFDNFKVMYLHWGAHAWAVYGIVAIGLGYFSYNKKLPFALRSIFYPLLKDKIFGIAGDIIDTITVLSVLFGLATSLGLGAQQINSGLNYVFGIEFTSGVQVLLIIIITFFATLSVVSGISKGIKWLSEANVVLSGLLLLGILLIGPTTNILATYLSSTGLYFKEFIEIGLFTGIKPEDVAWQGGWTIFYWAWWLSWAPFVGTFIARISKGKTIRQIAFGTIFIPTLVITFAMTILGAAGTYTNDANNGVIEKAVNNNIATAMFEMFQYLTTIPLLTTILSIAAIIAIILFFVTSSDSGSLVVSSLTSSGKTNPPKVQRIFWAAMEGAIALSVLLIGGEAALTTLQSAVVILGLPFGIILIMMMASMVKELELSYKKFNYNRTIKLRNTLNEMDDDTTYK